MKVYKYMKRQYALDALRTHELVATAPNVFNDPFDCVGTCHGDFGEIAKGQFKSKKILKELLFLRNVLSEKVRVLSFVDANIFDNKTEMLLWSHYADNGNGVRITFEFENEREFSQVPTKARHVSYCDSIPSLDLDRYEKDQHIFNRFLDECVWTKGTSWAYEHEIRLIAMAQELRPMSKCSNLMCVEFNPKCVKEIVFGPRVSISGMKDALDVIADEYGDSATIGKANRNDKVFRYDYIWDPQRVDKRV